ncbi:afadin- and alpha-actinin-binding protein-like [Protobothrops mucrosquamatus]|uniref:afadin- and alpha-actinin-binding protein-like n=1 Tax=Protobothrops mucrosquamatus TaxID=103944 RepID=UPI0010FB67B1|nr:afadin- and alpha-actinin-binding protein-like [Protobothrops mucrosquamatus]
MRCMNPVVKHPKHRNLMIHCLNGGLSLGVPNPRLTLQQVGFHACCFITTNSSSSSDKKKESHGNEQRFMSKYISELDFSSAESAFSPAHFTDSLELQGNFHELDNTVCWSDNVDHCISYLNKEMVALGFPALYKDDGSGDGIEHGFDLLELVNGACRLLNLYQNASARLGDVETEKMRWDEELDYLRGEQGKLKEHVEVLEREIAIVQNKEQQLQSKNKHLNDMLKEEKEEITKLLSSLANQKNQHGHEMKRKEQELLRLKDKMSQILTNKTDKRGTIEILNVLPRMDGKRATWKTGRSLGRKEEELYRIQLAKQEQREEGLAFENTKLKQLLNEVTQDLEEMLATDGGSARSRFMRIKSTSSQSPFLSFCPAVGCQMSEGDGPNPVVIVTDHDKEIMKLKKEIEESRGLIALQQQCFQEQLMSAANSELPAHLKGSYFLEEQQQLQEERELFEEQKQAFEGERKNFTEAAIRLGWERKQFEEQKAQFLKQEFLKSFPKLDRRNTKWRLSAPLPLGEEQDCEESPRLKKWARPICTPHPKFLITPCHTPTDLFRSKQLSCKTSSPVIGKKQILSDNW